MDSEPKRRLLFEPEEPTRSPLKWLVPLTVLACAAGGAFFAWAQMRVAYTAEGHLWLEAEAHRSHVASDPLRSDLDPPLVVSLLRSDEVLDWVAYHERLFLEVDRGYVDMLQGLWLAEAIRPGTYEMQVSSNASHFMLKTGDGALVQQGRLGNGTVGAAIGLRWTPGPGDLPPGARFRFRVLTPGDAARRLNEQLRLRMGLGNSLVVSLDGADPEDTSRIVNALMDRLVEVAGERQRGQHHALLQELEERVPSVAILDYALVPGRPTIGARIPLVFTFLSGVLGTLWVVSLPPGRLPLRSQRDYEEGGTDADDGLAVAGVLVGALGAAFITALFLL